MSRTFSTKSGSVESLKDSARWGWSPKACQIRRMVVWLSPTSSAIDRVDQWVASSGFSSSVFTITASTWSSVMERGTPGRGSSDSPPRRCSTKRRRHLPTMASLTPSFEPTSRLVSPLAQHSTIRARMAIAWALLRRLARRSSVNRSSTLSVNSAFGRPRGPMSVSHCRRSQGRTRRSMGKFLIRQYFFRISGSEH